jgi:diguanylate cyclase (GGDEF)-like protein
VKLSESKGSVPFALAVTTGLGAAVGYLVSQLRVSQTKASAEREAMAAASETLRVRNTQLTSLHHVFSEMTETLTLNNVVRTTLRETHKIISADMVVMRKLQDGQLVVIGAMADGGVEIQGLEPVPVSGEGHTSRVARRGRSLRIDSDGELTMGGRTTAVGPTSPSTQTGRPPLESGIITPLIVGARVVGTMSCWSREKYRFTADDERLLEMLSSSVATAIVASEAVANSERHAHIDSLTTLPNRRQLNEDLDGIFEDASTLGTEAVVAMADIDHFKRFNDEYGHRFGDVILQAVAEALRSGIRDTDHIYRYGGEEFVIVFKDTTSEVATQVAERLRAAVENLRLKTEEHRPAPPVTISIGLACHPVHSSDVGELIELADVAMYQSKTSGRNRVTVWEQTAEIQKAA